VRAARVKGLTVSFDGNYRKSLWDQWPTDGAAVLADIVAAADILIGDDRDVALILGHDFPQTDPMERRLAAAEAAFTGFPQLSRVASTHRTVHDATRHGLAGFLAERDGHWTAPPRGIGGIVDRIGGGDAFAAGLIHGLRTQMAPQAALDFALAAAALKHSIPGDFNLVDLADVEALIAGGGDVRR
jgi:2-dehydro-3-deoxygluconokinase